MAVLPRAARPLKTLWRSMRRLLQTASLGVLLQCLALIWVPSAKGRDDVSGGHLEQPGDELCLGPDVAATDVPNLPFPDHRHRLVARQRSSGRPKATKAKFARAGEFATEGRS